MNDLYIVVGVSGVGKSTILNKLFSQDYNGSGLVRVNFGDVLTDLLVKDGVVRTRDEIRAKVDQSAWVDYQVRTARHIAGLDGKIVMDTHACLPSQSGYFPGLPEHVVKNLPPAKVLFVISASPEDIMVRRSEDASRKRDHYFEKSIDSVREYQVMTLMYAAAYSSRTGARVKIVQNHNDGLDNAVQEIKSVLLI